MFDIVFFIFIAACLVGMYLVGYLNGQRNTKEGTPSTSHNSASDESLKYLDMAKGAVRGKGYITAIRYIDAAIANLCT